VDVRRLRRTYGPYARLLVGGGLRVAAPVRRRAVEQLRGAARRPSTQTTCTLRDRSPRRRGAHSEHATWLTNQFEHNGWRARRRIRRLIPGAGSLSSVQQQSPVHLGASTGPMSEGVEDTKRCESGAGKADLDVFWPASPARNTSAVSRLSCRPGANPPLIGAGSMQTRSSPR